MMNEELHLVSLIIQVRPEHLITMNQEISAIEGAEVHCSDPKGKLVVTLEADTNKQLMEKITQVEHLNHLISTSLVYHQIA